MIEGILVTLVVLGLISALVRPGASINSLVPGILGAAIAIGLIFFNKEPKVATQIAVGLGFAALWLSALRGHPGGPGLWLSGVAVGVASGSFLVQGPSEVPLAMLRPVAASAAALLGIAAFFRSLPEASKGAIFAFPVAAIATGVTSSLTGATEVEALKILGPGIGVAVVIVGLIASFAKNREVSDFLIVPAISGAALYGYITTQSKVQELTLIAVVAAFAAALCVGVARSTFSRWATLMSAVVALALANVAFTEGRGHGVALIMVFLLAVAGVLGEWKVMAGMTAGAAIGVLRAVRYAYPDTTSTLDMGNHYALMGVVFGFALVAVAVEIARNDWRTTWASGFAGLLIVPGLCLYLGSKGAVGMVVGMALAGALAFNAHRHALAAAACGLTGTGVVLASFGWVSPLLTGPRDERLKWLGYLLVPAALLVVVGFGLNKKRVA